MGHMQEDRSVFRWQGICFQCLHFTIFIVSMEELYKLFWVVVFLVPELSSLLGGLLLKNNSPAPRSHSNCRKSQKNTSCTQIIIIYNNNNNNAIPNFYAYNSLICKVE